MQYLVTINFGRNKKVTAITEYDLPMEPLDSCLITEGDQQSEIAFSYPSGKYILYTSDRIPVNANNTKAVSISVADM